MVGSQQFPRIRSGIVLVPLDVRVVDPKGNPVKDLKASDFVVHEDDVVQEIAHFQTVDYAAVGGVTPTATEHPLAATSTAHRTFILVLGRGRTNGPVKGIDTLIEMVRDDLLPSDRVGLVSYLRVSDPSTDHASVLRFLTEYRKRHEEIEGWLDRDSSRLYGADIELSDRSRRAMESLFAQEGVPRFHPLPGAAGSAPYRYGIFGTVRWALEYACRLPGEKQMIVLSQDGIPLGRYVDNPQEHVLVRMATTGRVALSYVNTGGLSGMSVIKGQVFIPLVAEGDAVESILGIQDSEFFAPSDHRHLTDLTGGVASFYRYARGPVDFVNRSSTFQYLLGYYPKTASAPDTFRRIRVTVTRPGVRVLHRRGYQLEWSSRDATDLRRAVADLRLKSALERLKGTPSALTMRYPRLRRNSLTILKSELKTTATGHSVAMTLSLDPSRLAFSKEGTSHRLTVSVAIEVDGLDGEIVGEKREDIDNLFSPADYERSRKQSIAFDLEIPVTGAVSRVRVATYDYESDRAWYILRGITKR